MSDEDDREHTERFRDRPGNLRRETETDPRFPSGPWIGFYLQKAKPGKHSMELDLYFLNGQMMGEGRDNVGDFIIRGRYDLQTGKCNWAKRYLSKHDVVYEGFNEGKGIWGTWIIPPGADPNYERGGFHIWPKGMRDPSNPEKSTGEALSLEEEDASTWSEVFAPSEEVLAPIGGS